MRRLSVRDECPAALLSRMCSCRSPKSIASPPPRWTVFERAEGNGTQRPALAIGRAHTDALPAEQLGRLGQVLAVAAGVRAALADAGIERAADVHFVQVKCPLLTARRIGEAEQ